MDLSLFQLSSSSTIHEAMSVIDKNKKGCLFLVNDNDQVVAIVTDGDIRRFLLKSSNTQTLLRDFMNKDFVWVNEGTSREKVLKLLDHKIHVIPVLNKDRKLVSIVTRETFPLSVEKKFYARSKSPVRISFGGGGSDLTHYFMENNGVVMNSTICMYSHATLKKREDDRVIIHSHDLKESVDAASISEIKNEKFSLISSLIKLINPDFGFELEVGSDFPVGSGLGGSAVVLSAIAGCFNQFRTDTWDSYEIAEICFQAERLSLGVAGGWQDQYATVFGGFNFMEFNKDQNIIHPLRVKQDVIKELEESLILCYTGKLHQSGDIQGEFKKNMTSSEEVQKDLAENKKLTYDMKSMLLKGNLPEFGRSIHKIWQYKRRFSEGITDNRLDEIYDFAHSNGAVGGKLLGAGGGGYFLFFVEPFKKYKLIELLEEKGLSVKNLIFDERGLQSWKVRL